MNVYDAIQQHRRHMIRSLQRRGYRVRRAFAEIEEARAHFLSLVARVNKSRRKRRKPVAA